MKILRRVIPVWLVVIILLMMGVVVAIAVTELPSEHISLFGVGVTSSVFTITSTDTSFHGPNKITVKMVLSNTDVTNSHSADVTVWLVDASGNNIMNETLPTGSVAGGGSVSLTFSFSSSGITAEYGSTFIQIKDTS